MLFCANGKENSRARFIQRKTYAATVTNCFDFAGAKS
jgi:hypothetical protein